MFIVLLSIVTSGVWLTKGLPSFQLLAILMLSGYVHGSKISALEKAFDRNLLASFLLVNITSCSFIHSCAKRILYFLLWLKEITQQVFLLSLCWQMFSLGWLTSLSVGTLFASSVSAILILIVYAFCMLSLGS